MNLQTVHVEKYGQLSIGDCVAAELRRLSQESDVPLRILAVVPRMLSSHAASSTNHPHFVVVGYEVTDVDIILEV